MNEQLLDTLIALERSLHEPANRTDRARLEALLHPEFSEIGRSGRLWTRIEIVESLLAQSTPVTIHAQDFVAQTLAEGLVLLLYKSAHVAENGGLQRHTQRSSIWRLSPMGWQMFFHQGTATDAFA